MSRRYSLMSLAEAARHRWTARLMDHAPGCRRVALLLARQVLAAARAHRMEARPIP